MADFTTWDSYLWEPGGMTLRNKFEERNFFDLSVKEYRETSKRQTEIDSGKVRIPRTYDADHLKAIHRHLFQNVYEWAGEYRNVNMSKGGGVGFADKNGEIDIYLKHASQVIKDVKWADVSRDEFAIGAATTLALVNQAHPFREGNGRTQKVFLEHVAEQSQFSLDYSKVTPEVWNQASMLSAPDRGSVVPVPDSLVPVFQHIAVPRGTLAPAEPEVTSSTRRSAREASYPRSANDQLRTRGTDPQARSQSRGDASAGSSYARDNDSGREQ